MTLPEQVFHKVRVSLIAAYAEQEGSDLPNPYWASLTPAYDTDDTTLIGHRLEMFIPVDEPPSKPFWGPY